MKPLNRLAKQRSTLAAVVAATLTLAACGSSSNGIGSSTTSSAAIAATSSSTAGSSAGSDGSGSSAPSSSGGPVSGDPIKVMTITSIETGGVAYPNVGETAKLYAKFINDNGGINGRPLEVEVCDQKVDPNAALACARQAVSDKVVAVVGSYTTYISSFLPVLEEAKIAWFGPAAPTFGVETTSVDSFVLSPQMLSFSASAFKAYKDGCKGIGFIVSSAAIQPQLIAAATKGLQAAGGKGFTVTVKAPATTGDMTLQATQLTDGGIDCIVGVIGEQTWSALIPALAQTAKTPRLYAPFGQITPAVAQQFSSSVQGAQMTGPTADLSSPAFADFAGAIAKYNPPSDLNYNSTNLETWAAFDAFRQVVANVKGDVNSENFVNAAGQTSIKSKGMIGDADLTKPFASTVAPRLFNRELATSTFDAGKLVSSAAKFSDYSDLVPKQ